MSKDVEKTEYGTGTWDTPPSDEDYTLEEILAEYGSSRQQKIMEEVERETAPAEPDTPKAPAPEQPSAPKPTETAPSPTPKSAMALWEERITAAALEQDGKAPLADDSDPEEEPRTDDGPEPEATRFLSLEELVGTTVGAVMEEHHETLLKPKWGLFSRKRQEETEQLYDSMEAPEEPVKPLTEAESIGEEPELSEVASEEREAYKSRHRSLGFAFFTALVPIAAMAAEQYGVTVPFWTGDRQIQGVAMLACLLIELVLCWHVPVYAIRKLSEKRCVSALLVSLAVLAAVFAVKYEASENVDYALRTLRRSRITPILAVRDPNITPALLKRKFYKKIKVEYPQLTDRVALSEAEEDRGLPRALLLREGLLPYAEAVVGSRRLRTAVRRATWLSLAGSAAGVLLTAYLVSLGKFDLLTPLSLTVFLLLWTLPVLLMSDWTGRY